MIAALTKEIRFSVNHPGTTPVVEKEVVETIYFGGGTPSILEGHDLQQLFTALKDVFIFSATAEITLECNPDDITAERLMEWTSFGINRLSVGLQSFSDKELSWMNRAHTASQSLASIDMIRKAGFTNFSVDLIYGSPLLSDEDWKANMEIVIASDIPHISCYALTVEPGTALDKMILSKKTKPVDADRQAEQFILLMNRMEEAGYDHYEISNFAKPGFRSRHNSSYWSGESYYGFGPSAHSYDGKRRRWNIANNALYIQSLQNNKLPFEEETLSHQQQLNEYIMISLRTAEGLDLRKLGDRFGKDKSDQILLSGRKYMDSHKLLLNDDRLVLTKEGKLFADGIAADLFF